MTPQEASQEALLRIEKVEKDKHPWLHLSNIPIDRLPQRLRRLNQLSALFVRECASLTDIQHLANLASLRRLDLSGCTSLREISPVAGLHCLEELTLKDCAQVSDLAPIQDLTSLRMIDLSGCSEIEDLSPLSSLTSLNELGLQGCTKVTDLSPLGNLPALESLDISRCAGVTDVSPIATLATLKRLHIDRCEGITSLGHLRHLLFTLEELSIFGCDLDEAFVSGKRFKENVLFSVRQYYDEMDRLRALISKTLAKEEELFLSAEAGYKRYAGTILTAFLLALLAYLLWLAWPPGLPSSKMLVWLVSLLFDGHLSDRKSYLDYSKVVVEVLLAIVVSGSVFATNIRKWVEDWLDKLTGWFNHIFERSIQKSIDDVLGQHRAAAHFFVWTLEKPRRRFGRFLVGVFRIVYTAAVDSISLVTSLLNRIFYLFFWTILAKFPGGAFGALAFLLFLLLTVIKILRLYCDAVPRQ